MKNILSTLLLLVMLPLAVPPLAALSLIGGGSDEELLDPETAFAKQASVNNNGELQIEIAIARGYYLYKNKIRVESDGADIGKPELPPGILKKDEFFGEVETYRDLLTFNSPVRADKAGPLSINVTSQGCADIGVCYPPQTKTLTVDIPQTMLASVSAPANPADPATSSLSNSDRLPTSALLTNGLQTSDSQSSAAASSLLSNSTSAGSSLLADLAPADADILDPDEAFVLQAEPPEGNHAVISWSIADGYYMYQHKFSFEVTAPGQVGVTNVELTPGQTQTDEFYGEVQVNRNFASARVALNNLPSANATIKVGYQGCADIGVCYPPQYKMVEAAFTPDAIALSTGADTPPTAESTNVLASPAQTQTPAATASSVSIVSEQDRLASSLQSGSRLTTIATFFGLGLLLAFTPCVLPMVPILSSLIVGQGQATTTGRSFLLSLVYVLAMALTYTIAGVLVGLSGENIQATLQHPAILITFAILFVVLAASMFGLFKLQMPSFVQNKLTDISNKQKGGSYGGVAIMGVLSALIVGPCVTAPLVGALIYIGQTGDAVLGGAALFALSMGMGVPLLIIGTSFGKYLPTVGPWMNVINAVFGVMLLAVAIWMLERIIPSWATMTLAALLLISVGFFMGAFDSTVSQNNNWLKLSRGFGYAAIVYGTLLIIGLSTGQGTLLRPLQGLALSNHTEGGNTAHVAFSRIKGIDELNTALASARAASKPVILDFYADWCVSCKEMEAFTFTDPKVAARMNQAILLQTDVTDNDNKDKELLRKFSLYGPPAIIFYTPDGEELTNARVVGYMNAEKFGNHLDIVL
jgi:thiol:disulfide interchange protein DsbD